MAFKMKGWKSHDKPGALRAEDLNQLEDTYEKKEIKRNLFGRERDVTRICKLTRNINFQSVF